MARSRQDGMAALRGQGMGLVFEVLECGMAIRRDGDRALAGADHGEPLAMVREIS